MDNTESVNWSELRRKRGLTLQQAAAQSGYGVATINGLEKRGEGSERLKLALAKLYNFALPGYNPDYVQHPEKYAAPLKEYAEDMAAAVVQEDRIRAEQSLRTKTAIQSEREDLREQRDEALAKIERLKKLLKEALEEL